MKEQTFPRITKGLIKSLEERFPSQDFGVSESVCKLNYHYGQRSVINFLKNQYRIQNESVLNSPTLK